MSNVYDMYVGNGNRVGFWVIRHSWSAHVARVISIADCTSGKLRGKPPYYSNPPVKMHLYSLLTGERKMEDGSYDIDLSCPGTYRYNELYEESVLETLMSLGANIPDIEEKAATWTREEAKESILSQKLMVVSGKSKSGSKIADLLNKLDNGDYFLDVTIFKVIPEYDFMEAKYGEPSFHIGWSIKVLEPSENGPCVPHDMPMNDIGENSKFHHFAYAIKIPFTKKKKVTKKVGGEILTEIIQKLNELRIEMLVTEGLE